ncbi:MAG TPA: ASKHA domain-containing protein [Anaerolineales bacterium]|nr:ASKHA domain-containing protein [Anaerolineales bacterium]
MADCQVKFEGSPKVVTVPAGTLLSEAARLAGVDMLQPCGGQGRCGRCVVRVLEGDVRRRSTLRLSQEDLDLGFALACQTVVEGDVHLFVPPQEKIERRLTTDLTVADVTVPSGYDPQFDQTIRRVHLQLKAPSMDDQTDDLSRLITALRQQAGFSEVNISLPLLQIIGAVLREDDWRVTAIVDKLIEPVEQFRLVNLIPGWIDLDEPLWGAAIDIGTTTVTVWLVDLTSGEVRAQASEYNGQISRGEDVISRIVFASKEGGQEEMRNLVLVTINQLAKIACQRASAHSPQAKQIQTSDIYKATVSGNSTMTHLLLGLPAASIRLSPFVTAANHMPPYTAREVGVAINPEATVDCLPGVASYVGSDISAGVLASGMDDTAKITLFMDVGTNGEIVLGSREWLVTCACSAGPAFEGAGVVNGMRATQGAIDEVWINADNYEPSYRVIGGTRPRGICGSGLLSLLAELFMTGLVDKAGHLNSQLVHPRVREGEHGLEYVVAWSSETEHGNDIAITHVDIDNLIRAKGAIYAGYSVLAESVGISFDLVEQMLIGGSFGKYINVEKAIQIGLLPDLPWDRFKFLGNTSVKGAYQALLNYRERERVSEIASRMTYIELSADNSFFEAFMSALFLPHTDMHRFPSVMQALGKGTTAEN